MTAFNARRHAAVYDILTPEAPRARLSRPRHSTPETAIDAEFVILREASAPRRPGNDNRTLPAQSLTEWLHAAIERGETWLSRLSANLFSALVAGLFVAVFTMAGGLSGFFAERAPAVPAQPLVITHASLTPQEANGMKLLTVNGIVENHGAGRMTVPKIRADLMAGQTLVASIVIPPPVAAIEAGHSHGFAARIAYPGGKTPELKLSFSREDVPGL